MQNFLATVERYTFLLSSYMKDAKSSMVNKSEPSTIFVVIDLKIVSICFILWFESIELNLFFVKKNNNTLNWHVLSALKRQKTEKCRAYFLLFLHSYVNCITIFWYYSLVQWYFKSALLFHFLYKIVTCHIYSLLFFFLYWSEKHKSDTAVVILNEI